MIDNNEHQQDETKHLKKKNNSFYWWKRRVFFLLNNNEQQEKTREVGRKKSEPKECVKGNKMCLRSFIFACRNLRLLFITLHLLDVPRNYVVYGFSERWALNFFDEFLVLLDRHTSSHLSPPLTLHSKLYIVLLLITPFSVVSIENLLNL